MRIVRADALGQDILDTRHLDHGANAAAGNDAGAVRSRLENHVARAIAADHFKRNGAVHDRHADQVFLGLLQTFADRFRHFLRLTHAVTDYGTAVAHDDESTEAETPSALHHLGHPADVNDFFLKVQSLRVDPFQRHLSSKILRLEFQSAFAGAVGYRLNAPVKEKAIAVENNPVDVFFLTHFCQCQPDLLGGYDALAGFVSL